jgi:hypothetical protein
MALADLVRQLGDALLGAVAPQALTLTSGHYGALAKLLGGLPVGDLTNLFDGRATVDTDLDLAEQAAALVAVAFPPAAITAGEVELALEALQFLFDAAGLGAQPFKIEGGVPAAFPPGGGPGPYRGR